MKFEDRPGLFHPAAPSSPGAMAVRFEDRPFYSHRPAASAPKHAEPALKFEDRPGYSNPRPVLSMKAIESPFRFEHRPGPISSSARASAASFFFAPLGFAEFCAAETCDELSFARRRAVLTPVAWDEYRLNAHVAAASAYAASVNFQSPTLPDQWKVAVVTDQCNLMSLPKRNHLSCLGLPGEKLKDKAGFASPLFRRAGLIPRGGGRFTIGKPYRVSGRLYRPKNDPSYDQTGIASWYGGGFHRRMTANGEWFDMEYLSAAHPTLPLPSYARVTNLVNGKEMIVRVNDRGPFVGGRIIDLSKKCAELLGFKKQGKAKVRVQYVGPAPLDDRGSHLAAMNRELERGTPQDQMIAAASGLRHQALLVDALRRSYTE